MHLSFCFVLRNTVGIKTRLILNLIQLYAIHIERRISHNIVEIIKAIIRITIIGVSCIMGTQHLAGAFSWSGRMLAPQKRLKQFGGCFYMEDHQQ